MDAGKMKPKRIRRTKAELDECLWTALEKLIIEKGFDNITLTGLAKEAKMEPPVIYNRFKDLEQLIETYARRYDYWLSDIVRFDTKLSPKENLKILIVNLINELYGNEIMQKILLWELNGNRIAQRMAMNREFENTPLIEYLNSSLSNNKSFNFNTFNSLLISGIYYLILHRKVSTFSHINFDTEQGKEQLIDTIIKLIDILL